MFSDSEILSELLVESGGTGLGPKKSSHLFTRNARGRRVERLPSLDVIEGNPEYNPEEVVDPLDSGLDEIEG